MPFTAAQLTQYYSRVNIGQAPDAATMTAIQTAASQNASGQLTDAQALAVVLNGAQVRATTDVAVSSYQFFTSAVPTQAGVNFLVNNPGTGYNTSFYNGASGSATAPSAGGFNLENRYFNAALNLGANPAGQSFQSFVTNYGSISLQQTVNVAYEAIVGVASVGSAQFAAATAAITAAIPYFQQVAAQRASTFNQDLATKSIIIGYVLEEAIKADVGTYARALDQFNASLAVGTALFNTNLITSYSGNGAGVNAGIGAGALNGGAPLAAGSTTMAPAGALVSTVGVAANGFATLGVVSGTNIVLGSDISTNNGQLIVAVPNATNPANLDSLTFSYRGIALSTVSSVVADGVETVAVDARGGAGAPAGTTLSFDITDSSLRTLNITGDTSVIFAAQQYATVVGGQVVPNGGALTTVNASGATAAVFLDVTATTGTPAAPVSIAGGSAADTLAFTNNTLVVGGAGADTFVVYAPTSGTSLSSISDEAAGDMFQFRTSAGGLVRVTAFNGTPVNVGANASYQSALDAASGSSSTGAVSVFNFGGDTYLVQDNSPGSATFQAGVDSVVRLVGMHNLAGSTIVAGGLVSAG